MKKFLFLLVGLVLLTGCGMKGGYDLVIKSDKTIDFSFFMAYDDEMIQALMSMQSGGEEIPTYTDEDVWELLESMNGEAPEGFTMERYDQDGYKGFTYDATDVGNIDEATGDGSPFDITNMDSNMDDTMLFTKNGDNYVSNIVYSPVNESQGQDAEIDIKFTVTLPNKPISHNATTVSDDGKTLTWDLSGTEAGTIDFEFNFSSFPILMVALIGGGIALLVILIVIILVVKKSKKKKQNLNSGVANSEPQVMPNDSADTIETVEEPVVEPTNTWSTQPEVKPVTQPSVSAQPSMSQPQPSVSTQPSMSQPQPSVSTQPSMSQPQPSVSTQPSMSQPQPSVSTQPSMSQPQPSVSTQPSMSQPQPSVSTQPSMSQPQAPRTFLNQQSSTQQPTITSVDDLLKSTPSDNQNNQ